MRTPAEFWQHWHITLSSWLRDYLFPPISYALSRRLDGVRWLGLRDEFWIYAGATMATMLLGGLWHGAAWTFVLWGTYQGLLLVGFRAWRMTARRRKRGRRGARSPVAAALGVAAMFHLTCLGWLLFRAGSLGQAVSLAGALLGRFDPSWGVVAAEGSQLVFYTAPLLAIHAFEARHDDLAVAFRWPPAVRCAVCVALAYFIVLFGDYAGAQFIYDLTKGERRRHVREQQYAAERAATDRTPIHSSFTVFARRFSPAFCASLLASARTDVERRALRLLFDGEADVDALAEALDVASSSAAERRQAIRAFAGWIQRHIARFGRKRLGR